MAVVCSVNVGELTTGRTRARRGTGIDKQPVAAVEVRAPGPKKGGLGSGVVGDAIGDGRHHGGDDQAVYAFAREELDWWAAELGRELRDGTFGENLTIEGLDVDAAEVGSTWRVGSAVLRVSGPRIPCRTFATHMGEPRWVRRFSERGRTGAYLAVESPGTIRAGDPVEVLSVPGHGFTVPDSFRALMGDLGVARTMLDAGAASGQLREELTAMLAARLGAPSP